MDIFQTKTDSVIPQKTAQGTTLGLFPNQSSPVGFKKIFGGMNGPDLGLLLKIGEGEEIIQGWVAEKCWSGALRRDKGGG